MKASNVTREWSNRELEKLLRLWGGSAPNKTIYAMMGRSKGSCYGVLFRNGLVISRESHRAQRRAAQ